MSSHSEPPEDYAVYFPHPVHPLEISLEVDKNSSRHLSKLVEVVINKQLGPEVDPEAYTLFKPPGLSLEPGETLLDRSRQWLREYHDSRDFKIRPTAKVRNAFPEGPSQDDVVDILVVTPETLESLDDVGALAASHRKVIREREKEAKNVRTSLPRPSEGITTHVQKLFNECGDRFHAGRPHDNYGPPVALFHPTLGLLAYRLRHLGSALPEGEPNYLELGKVHSFMALALNCYDVGEDRILAIGSLLEDLLACTLSWDVPISDIRPNIAMGGSKPFGFVEVKNEDGLHGDAFLQASLDYARVVTDDKNELIRQRRRRSNYPVILISIRGDLLEIGIAVYTDGPYIDRLFSERLRLDFYRNNNVLRVARAFKAVQLATGELTEFYARLDAAPPSSSITHLFPSPVPVPSCKDSMPSLTFTNRMSRAGELYLMARSSDQRCSPIYFATMPKSTGAGDTPDGEVEVIVKFTARYNAEAHRILAAAGLAPTLHAIIPVCDRIFMVVMDRVEGETAWSFEQRNELLPHSVYADVKTAVDLLHEHDLVFGDLRAPNIMCVRRSGGAGSDEHWSAMLIDFDWAGTHSSASYPAIMNDQLSDWIPTMRRLGLMRKEHDLGMLERFKLLCQPTVA
ncbi:uncharacterized protein B0H18DRAFT_518681 [Fomitopsis serialis]|uniref:uncharacterized protein n=1 Tax=Fomitopsis serialis TaxID=139415 RepID=UPI0020089B7E|nr:uncharacterized protein B0H18DRAFT_518681 [Neoantrodia serialis]KAH9922405.1 hypothetical protein B0H18DRAFT_518681 [Neoantrodia serialis]